MAFKTATQIAQNKVDRGEILGRLSNYFSPPHGGRPPSDEAVTKATQRYIEQERRGELRDLPSVHPTFR